MNNQIHNNRSAQSFFFYRHAESIPAPFTFQVPKFYNSLNEWMDRWIDGWMDGWREGRREGKERTEGRTKERLTE